MTISECDIITGRYVIVIRKKPYSDVTEDLLNEKKDSRQMSTRLISLRHARNC